MITLHDRAEGTLQCNAGGRVRRSTQKNGPPEESGRPLTIACHMKIVTIIYYILDLDVSVVVVFLIVESPFLFTEVSDLETVVAVSPAGVTTFVESVPSFFSELLLQATAKPAIANTNKNFFIC
jgi:hypothetical protein